MNEPNVVLFIAGLMIILIGFVIVTCAKLSDPKEKTSLIGLLIAILGIVIFFHSFLGARWLFIQNATSAVPMWVWVVAGITIYFNLNRIYTSWLGYANHHPDSLAEKILGPQPLGLLVSTEFANDRFILRILGIWFFCASWLIALAWLVFGGAAKLLHLLPRKY